MLAVEVVVAVWVHNVDIQRQEAMVVVAMVENICVLVTIGQVPFGGVLQLDMQVQQIPVVAVAVVALFKIVDQRGILQVEMVVKV
jgi:hypothetical protein